MLLLLAAAAAVALAVRGSDGDGGRPPGPGGLTAERIGAEAGIRETNHSYRANVGDIDGDGSEDLIFIPHWNAFPRVYLNDGNGVFTDISGTDFEETDALRARDRHDCPIGDASGDGRADIFCTTGGGGGGYGPKKSEMWFQQEDGTFVHSKDHDEFRLGHAADPYGRSRDAVFLDANGDGNLDLYIQNAYPRADGRSPISRLFINQGDRYRPGPEHGFTGANIPVGGSNLQAIDYDGDDWTDILACGKERVYLFRNEEGRDFEEVAEDVVGTLACTWAELAEVDGSGRPALIVLDGEELNVYRQRANGEFSPAAYTRPVTHGVSFATGDVNGNGVADVYVVRRGDTEDGEPSDEEDRPDLMLINSGGGTGFERMPIPQLEPGRGDTVTAIDHDGDGRAAFVVMNGYRQARGPIDMIAFRLPSAEPEEE